MDQLIRDDAHMYMSPEVMAMLDSGQMFTPDYIIQEDSFSDSSFLKMNGLVASP